jgi:hypothetical protein
VSEFIGMLALIDAFAYFFQILGKCHKLVI